MMFRLNQAQRLRIMRLLVGLVLTVISIGLCASLFYLVPNPRAERLLYSIFLMQLGDRSEHVLFFLCACVLFILCWAEPDCGRGKSRSYWCKLAGVFTSILLVKVFELRDALIQSLHGLDVLAGHPVSSVAVSGLSFAFVVGGILYFRRFVTALPPRVLNALLAGGLLYLLGANGMWGLHGWIVAQCGIESIPHAISDLCEDCLQLSGLVAFINGLLIQWENIEVQRKESPTL